METGRRVSARMKIGLLLLFLSIYLTSTMGHFWSSDHVSVYLTAQSLVENHSLAIKSVRDEVQGPDGEYYGVFGIGQAVLSIPLYLVGRAVDRLNMPFWRDYFGGYPYGDFSGSVPVFFVSLFNQFITPFTGLLVFLFCLRLGFSRATSLLTALIFGFSTLTWVLAEEYFQHPLETLLLLLSVYVLFANKDRLDARSALLSGTALGLGLLTRVNLIFLVPVVGVYLFFVASKTRAEDLAGRDMRQLLQATVRQLRAGAWRPLFAFAAPLALALALMLALNQVRFGSMWAFNPSAAEEGFDLAHLPLALYGFLFSAGRSVFLYSPPLLLSLFTFGPFFKQHRAEAILFLLIALVYLLTYSTYGYWEGGWSWGPRFLLAPIPFLMIPLGYFLGSRIRSAIVALLALIGAGVQIAGLSLNIGFVYMNWEQRNLKPPTAYLYVPNISAIPTHIRDLLAGHNIDLWLVQVYKRFDGTVFFATMGVLLLILAIGLALLFTSLKEPTLDRHRQSQIRATFEPTFPPTRRR